MSGFSSFSDRFRSALIFLSAFFNAFLEDCSVRNSSG